LDSLRASVPSKPGRKGFRSQGVWRKAAKRKGRRLDGSVREQSRTGPATPPKKSSMVRWDPRGENRGRPAARWDPRPGVKLRTLNRGHRKAVVPLPGSKNPPLCRRLNQQGTRPIRLPDTTGCDPQRHANSTPHAPGPHLVIGLMTPWTSTPTRAWSSPRACTEARAWPFPSFAPPWRPARSSSGVSDRRT